MTQPDFWDCFVRQLCFQTACKYNLKDNTRLGHKEQAHLISPPAVNQSLLQQNFSCSQEEEGLLVTVRLRESNPKDVMLTGNQLRGLPA